MIWYGTFHHMFCVGFFVGLCVNENVCRGVCFRRSHKSLSVCEPRGYFGDHVILGPTDAQNSASRVLDPHIFAKSRSRFFLFVCPSQKKKTSQIINSITGWPLHTSQVYCRLLNSHHEVCPTQCRATLGFRSPVTVPFSTQWWWRSCYIERSKFLVTKWCRYCSPSSHDWRRSIG